MKVKKEKEIERENLKQIEERRLSPSPEQENKDQNLYMEEQ